MKHPVEHLRFPKAAVEAVTEFRRIAGQMLLANAMIDAADIAFDPRLCSSLDYRCPKMVFGTS